MIPTSGAMSGTLCERPKPEFRPRADRRSPARVTIAGRQTVAELLRRQRRPLHARQRLNRVPLRVRIRLQERLDEVDDLRGLSARLPGQEKRDDDEKCGKVSTQAHVRHDDPPYGADCCLARSPGGRRHVVLAQSWTCPRLRTNSRTECVATSV